MTFCLATLLLLVAAPGLAEGPVPVTIARQGGKITLMRGGSPYMIHGVGGTTYPEVLKSRGGNSMRTWGADDLGPTLDHAQELGLTVAVGIWLGQPRQGFRYDDPNQVQGQFERVRNDIRRYRNHPAVLLWGLGNEMEGDGNDPKIWKAVNDLAKMAKAEDSNHPTMTVVAEVGGAKLANYMKNCPDVDILGVNSYAGLSSLPERLKKAGYNRPWIVTEFGPAGAWEVAKTRWDAPIEATSTAKAEMYAKNYAEAIDGKCLGSYAFLWGHKQEATATWFGLFLPSGESLGAVDSLQHGWTGQWPANRAPRIMKIECEAAGKEVAPGATFKAHLVADDPDNDSLTVHWEVRAESRDRRQGGDREASPPPYPNSFIEARGLDFQFQAPTEAGGCRVFVTLYDGKGHAATANMPFAVQSTK